MLCGRTWWTLPIRGSPLGPGSSSIERIAPIAVVSFSDARPVDCEPAHDLGGDLRVPATAPVDRLEVRDLAHPGQLAAGVVARALLHQLQVAAEQLVEAERLASRARG